MFYLIDYPLYDAGPSRCHLSSPLNDSSLYNFLFINKWRISILFIEFLIGKKMMPVE